MDVAMDLDDSDFYGDEDTTSGLQARVSHFDVDAWSKQQAASTGCPQRQRALPQQASHLHNPYAGVPYAWQLSETINHFLDRLPPATTQQTAAAPWIFVCNPYIPRVERSQGSNQLSKGNEDEAPEEEGSQLPHMLQGAQARLEILDNLAGRLAKAGKSEAVTERELGRERKQATGDLLKLAHAAKVRAGKWMLFCQPQEVNEIWGLVARATANNELGIAAKVAPKPDTLDQRKDRLICVYTKDFTDKQDVFRVVQSLRELRLVEARSRPIYYKPDAYTHIGIGSGNPWGLRASIYSSSDEFK